MADHNALVRAREVVGLYGDPYTTWKIALEMGLADPIRPADAARRAADLFARWPHLGAAPAIEVVPDDRWSERRETATAAPVQGEGRLVQVLLTESGTEVFVAAHHGVTDGLGLVALGGAVIGRPVTSLAQGIGDRSSSTSFLGAGMRRIGEALLRPPRRFQPHRPVTVGDDGEALLAETASRLDAGSPRLCLAVARVFAGWCAASNPKSRGPAGWPLFSVGASRRRPGVHVPDRRTAYLRLRVDPAWEVPQVRAALREAAPEPDFPETSARGLGPLVTGLLRRRLGATALISNLGVLEAEGLQRAAMFPAVSGPRAVAVGMASTAATTTLSVRTRRGEFATADTAELLQRISEALRADQYGS